MSYINFTTDIQLQYHVKVVGWPNDVEFSPPCDMSMTDVRKVRTALSTGSCRFVRMSKKEVEELSAKGVTRNSRATHSDKGKSRGTYKRWARKIRDNEDTSDKENEPRPRKRARTHLNLLNKLPNPAVLYNTCAADSASPWREKSSHTGCLLCLLVSWHLAWGSFRRLCKVPTVGNSSALIAVGTL